MAWEERRGGLFGRGGVGVGGAEVCWVGTVGQGTSGTSRPPASCRRPPDPGPLHPERPPPPSIAISAAAAGGGGARDAVQSVLGR
jgi:hypothetical protein